MLSDTTLHLGDCLEVLPTISDASIDAIITDPIYPEIDREYGRISEVEWHQLMRGVVAESRRILKPTGSAVFILQPNCSKVGSMRLWLWEFVAWAGREWNLVQDAHWWNTTALPEAQAIQGRLMRPSLKMCVWLGPPSCHRDQELVLWQESHKNAADRAAGRCGRDSRPSGEREGTTPRFYDDKRMHASAEKRGGVTPFNVIPISAQGRWNGGAHGHGAGTPQELTDWWTRYICPPGGTVCDPFCGSGTTGLSALKYGCNYVGIEKMPKYHEIASRRLAEAQADAASMLSFA